MEGVILGWERIEGVTFWRVHTTDGIFLLESSRIYNANGEFLQTGLDVPLTNQQIDEIISEIERNARLENDEEDDDENVSYSAYLKFKGPYLIFPEKESTT